MHSPTLAQLPPAPAGKTGWPWTEESPPLPPTMPAGSPWPKVSIVTPSYNQGQFLEETIRSVLLQGYPNLEYIIIDGGSTDNSVEIIRKYEPWLTYWVSEPDGGQSEAINKGWMCSKGQYLGWLNSDDILYSKMIQSAIKALALDHTIDAVYSDLAIIDEHSCPIGQVKAQEFRLESYVLRDYVPQQTALINHLVVKAIGGVDEAYQYTMDYDLFLRLGRQYHLKYIPEQWAAFRITHSTKTFSEGDGFGPETLRALEYFFENVGMDKGLYALRSKAYSRVYITSACRSFAIGDIKHGRDNIAKAIEIDRSLINHEWHEILNAILGWLAYPIMPDRLKYLQDAINSLPHELGGLSKFTRRRTLAQGAMTLFFNNKLYCSYGQRRQALRVAILNDPRWLFNRGVVIYLLRVCLYQLGLLREIKKL